MKTIWTPERRERARQTTLANPTRYWLGKKRAPVSEETRLKRSLAMKARWKDNPQLSSGMTGRKHSEETRAKMSASSTGKFHSAAARANISAAQKLRTWGPHSPEWTKKISAALKGRAPTQAVAQKLQEWRLANPDWRQLYSAARKGAKHSPEAIAKITAVSRRTVKYGVDHPRWGKPPSHAKRVEYNGNVFRSSYEVRFAKALDARGIQWEYEKQRFDLGACTYLPDFYIPETGAYWEVKGWFTLASQNKVRLFREQHPETPLIVANNAVIKMMEARVS